MTTFELLVVATFAFVSIVALAFKDGVNQRLSEENRKLREWQGAQTNAHGLGPHRAAPINTVSADGSCEHCGCHWMQTCDCRLRPARPAPTSVPSGGRIID